MIPASSQKGTSLIEVLVAVVVLAIGLLGVAGMQMSALRNNQSAYQRSAAAMLASSIVERMQANRAQVSTGAYNLAPGAPGCAAPAAGASLAQQDLASWIAEMKTPGMLGNLSCGGVNCVAIAGTSMRCTVTVRWQDDRTGVSGSQTLEMVVEARL